MKCELIYVLWYFRKHILLFCTLVMFPLGYVYIVQSCFLWCAIQTLITPIRPWILLVTWATILWAPSTRHCTRLLIHSTSSRADSSYLPFFSCKLLLSYQHFLMWSPFCLEIASYFCQSMYLTCFKMQLKIHLLRPAFHLWCCCFPSFALLHSIALQPFPFTDILLCFLRLACYSAL